MNSCRGSPPDEQTEWRYVNGSGDRGQETSRGDADLYLRPQSMCSPSSRRRPHPPDPSHRPHSSRVPTSPLSVARLHQHDDREHEHEEAEAEWFARDTILFPLSSLLLLRFSFLVALHLCGKRSKNNSIFIPRSSMPGLPSERASVIACHSGCRWTSLPINPFPQVHQRQQVN